MENQNAPERAIQNIMVKAEKPTQEQVLLDLYNRTVKKSFPVDAKLWSFVSTKLTYSEPLANETKQLLAEKFGGQFQARQIRNSTRPKSPIINPASTFTYTLRFDDKETFTQTFTLGRQGSDVSYITFGKEGRLDVPLTNSQLGMFMCLHPNNADSPAYWSEERKRKHGVYIEVMYATEPNFRNGWSSSIDANKPEISNNDLAREALMTALYSLTERQFEDVCAASLGLAYKTVGQNSDRRARLGSMIRNILPTNMRSVASAMSGSFLNIQNYVTKAEEVGIIRYDKDFAIWTARAADNPSSEDYGKHTHIPGTEIPTGTVWSDDPVIYLARLIDGQVDQVPRPHVFLPIRNRVDALSKEFKAIRKEAEEATDPNWMPDDDFRDFIGKAIESGALIVSKNTVSWGDTQMQPDGKPEEPAFRLQNGQDPLDKAMKLKREERSAIVARVLGR